MVTVVMVQNDLGEDGTTWRQGNSYPASTPYAKFLIGKGSAYADDASLPDIGLTAEQVSATQALVSGAGIGFAGAGKLLCDWSSNGAISLSGSTGATAVLDAGRLYDGSQMLCVTMGATGALTLTYTFSTEPTIAQLKALHIPIMIEGNSDDSGNALFSGAGIWLVKGSEQWRYTLPISGMRPMQPFCVSAAPGNATQGWAFGGGTPPTSTTDADDTTITSIRFVVTVTAAMAGKKVWLGPVTMNKRRKGCVSIVMDGAYISQHDYILPMLEAQGLRATLAIHAAAVGTAGYMTYAQLDRAKAAGHEFAHHTYNATIGNGYQDSGQYADEDAIYADILAGFENLEARGYIAPGERYAVHGGSVHPFTITDPGNNTTTATRQAAVVNAYRRAGTKAIRYGSIIGGAYERLQQLASLDGIDPYNVQGAVQITSSTTATNMTDIISRASTRGEWAIATVHRSVISTPSTLEMTNADFDTWIASLGATVRSGAIECLPFGAKCSALGLSGA